MTALPQHSQYGQQPKPYTIVSTGRVPPLDPGVLVPSGFYEDALSKGQVYNRSRLINNDHENRTRQSFHTI